MTAFFRLLGDREAKHYRVTLIGVLNRFKLIQAIRENKFVTISGSNCTLSWAFAKEIVDSIPYVVEEDCWIDEVENIQKYLSEYGVLEIKEITYE